MNTPPKRKEVDRMTGAQASTNRYSMTQDEQALKIPPKSVFSSEYRERKNLRVAAYCRVSTDRKEQATSFETQMKHYQMFADSHPDWSFHTDLLG